MTNSAIQYDLNPNGVATITLCRPDIHNAFDETVVAALTEAFKKAGSDESVRTVVLASTGKSFCAGGNIDWMRRMAAYTFEENQRDGELLADMLRQLNVLPKPTIARVQGPAYGGGVGLIACCDIVVASPAANLCFSEAKIGMIPATISPYVVRAMGERAARRYFMTAELISAARGKELGLISELVEASELDSVINNIVESVLKNGPRAIRESKRLVFDVSERVINDDLMVETAKRIAETRDSSEGREGLTAFLEKRKPRWIP